MRLKGTKYEAIPKLPAKAQPVSTFASEHGMAVGYVYIKYERALVSGKSAGYSIRCFMGTNYVIPQ